MSETKKDQTYRARLRGGKYRVLVNVPVVYDLDEAAAVMALEVPDTASQLGARTVRTSMQRAAERGLTGEQAKRQADPATADYYRAFLLEQGVFPAQA